MLYENDSNGIIQILKKFHKFVPCDNKQNQNREVTEDELEREDANKEPVLGEQGIVGDQLSVERGINGHMSLSNGFTKEEVLKDYILKLLNGMRVISSCRYVFHESISDGGVISYLM